MKRNIIISENSYHYHISLCKGGQFCNSPNQLPRKFLSLSHQFVQRGTILLQSLSITQILSHINFLEEWVINSVTHPSMFQMGTIIIILSHTNCQSISWATSWENLFMPYGNNIHVVWSAPFFFRSLDSIITLVSISKISSLYLASLAEQAGLSLTRSKTPKTGFLMTKLELYTVAICQLSVFQIKTTLPASTFLNQNISFFPLNQ